LFEDELPYRCRGFFRDGYSSRVSVCASGRKVFTGSAQGLEHTIFPVLGLRVLDLPVRQARFGVDAKMSQYRWYRLCKGVLHDGALLVVVRDEMVAAGFKDVSCGSGKVVLVLRDRTAGP
jgi:hypothetical protein